MQKSNFEQNSGAYRQVGDYLLPNLMLSEKGETHIGIWGQRHLKYIKEHKKGYYTILLTSGKLNDYLAKIDKQAEEMFVTLVEQMAKHKGITEQLKEENQLEWVQKMNNIRDRAIEIVNAELIFS